MIPSVATEYNSAVFTTVLNFRFFVLLFYLNWNQVKFATVVESDLTKVTYTVWVPTAVPA